MFKVMHLLNTDKYSGAENVVITMINSYKDNVDAVYVSMDGPIRAYLEENSISFFPIKRLTISEVKRAVNVCNPDIIHAHDFTAGIISAALLTKRPIVNHIHNNSPWIKHYNLKSVLYAFSCLKYKVLLTVSDSIIDEYVFGKIFKNKTKVVGNPIDVHKIKTMAGKNTEKTYDIAFLGRFSLQKNPGLFLEIVKTVSLIYPSLRVVMIGDGELREEIEKTIMLEKLDNVITLLGFKQNPYEYLKQAKFLLMPSLWEGYGLAAIEALSLGLPVICSDAGGLPNIVDDRCGKVCKNKQEYIDEIECLLNDESYLKKKTVSAKRKSDELDNLNEYKNMMLKVYTDVCN